MKNLIPGIIGGLTLFLLVFSALPVQAAYNFNDQAFEKVWNRVDLPVQNLPRVGRGYTWGPPFAPGAAITTEPYNGGTRKVQYFDKARMEINNPRANPADLYY